MYNLDVMACAQARGASARAGGGVCPLQYCVMPPASTPTPPHLLIGLHARGLNEERNAPALPVVQHHLRHGGKVRLTPLQNKQQGERERFKTCVLPYPTEAQHTAL